MPRASDQEACQTLAAGTVNARCSGENDVCKGNSMLLVFSEAPQVYEICVRTLELSAAAQCMCTQSSRKSHLVLSSSEPCCSLLRTIYSDSCTFLHICWVHATPTTPFSSGRVPTIHFCSTAIKVHMYLYTSVSTSTLGRSYIPRCEFGSRVFTLRATSGQHAASSVQFRIQPPRQQGTHKVVGIGALAIWNSPPRKCISCHTSFLAAPSPCHFVLFLLPWDPRFLRLHGSQEPV